VVGDTNDTFWNVGNDAWHIRAGVDAVERASRPLAKVGTEEATDYHFPAAFGPGSANLLASLASSNSKGIYVRRFRRAVGRSRPHFGGVSAPSTPMRANIVGLDHGHAHLLTGDNYDETTT
jgi:hypothetical protein